MKKSMEEQIQEGNFYAKIALKKAGHTGLMMMAMFNLNNAKQKGQDTALTKGLFTFSAILFLLDDVEVLVHAIKELRRRG